MGAPAPCEPGARLGGTFAAGGALAAPLHCVQLVALLDV